MTYAEGLLLISILSLSLLIWILLVSVLMLEDDSGGVLGAASSSSEERGVGLLLTLAKS